MRVYFSEEYNRIVVEGTKTTFFPLSIEASAADQKVALRFVITGSYVTSYLPFEWYKNEDNNSFATVDELLVYLSGVFTREKKARKVIWEAPTAGVKWSINHGLGYFPSVVLEDSAGNTFQPDVTNIDENNLEINFAYPMAGRAILH